MSLIINWIKLENSSDKLIEIPCLDNVLVVYSAKNVITKTEWRGLKTEEEPLAALKTPYCRILQYLTNPEGRLNVDVKMQGSHFRHKVWAEICKIPAGQTLTYSALADRVDSAARAVANACRDNPYPGIIPCHRVVAVSGLGGFMGQTGGELLDIKQRLLNYEAMLVNNNASLKESTQ